MKLKKLAVLSTTLILVGCGGGNKPTPTPSVFPDFPGKNTSFDITLSNISDVKSQVSNVLTIQAKDFKTLILDWGFKNFQLNNVTKTISNNKINDKETKLIEWTQNKVDFCLNIDTEQVIMTNNYYHMTTDLNENVLSQTSNTKIYFFNKENKTVGAKLTYVNVNSKKYYTNFTGTGEVTNFTDAYDYIINTDLSRYATMMKTSIYTLNDSYIDKLSTYSSHKFGKLSDDPNYSLGIEASNSIDNYEETVGEKSVAVTGPYKINTYHLYTDSLLVNNDIEMTYSLESADKNTYKKETKKYGQRITVGCETYQDPDLTGYTPAD